MTTFVHSDLDVSAAKVVASGQALYPTQARASAAAAIALHPNASPMSEADRAKILENPGFGQYFSDNVVRATWNKANGWNAGELISSATSSGGFGMNALHYGQSIFEGLKAYRHEDGSIYTFRPEANALRFQRSATRLALPPVPTDLFIGAIETLVRQDQAWVPSDPDKSLY